jgi:hypothetical protein
LRRNGGGLPLTRHLPDGTDRRWWQAMRSGASAHQITQELIGCCGVVASMPVWMEILINVIGYGGFIAVATYHRSPDEKFPDC